MLLQEDVRRLGLDPAAISRQDGVEPLNALRRLQSGDADYVLAFEPWGSLAELDSLGAVVSAGARRGPLAFTSFYANSTFMATRSESVTRLTDGLRRALDFVRGTDPAKLAAIIKPWFPDFDEPLLATAIARYQRLDLWPSDPAMTADGYTRLKSSLLSSGYIKSDPAFEKVCR
jgi:NitT/TauT family transport system substrate-binding protein